MQGQQEKQEIGKTKNIDKLNEHKMRTDMIRNSTIKNLRRKNLEVSNYYNAISQVMIERQIQNQEKQRQKQSKTQMNSAMLVLKTLTFGIIIRIAGAMFQSLLSLSACVVYVVNTYYEDSQALQEIIINIMSRDGVFAFFEILFATLFSIDYILGFYNAKNKKKFFFNALNMVDLVTILPVFVSYVPGGESSAGNALKRFIGVVRVLRVFRVLRLYRLFMSQGPDQAKGGPFAESSEVKRKIIMISATILAIVFISTGIIYSFNKMDINFIIEMPDENEKLTFDSAFYFMVVTVCTVGYGDIKPGSDLARIIVGIFIIMIIVLVSKQTSELNELMKFSSQYRVPYTGQERGHIVLIGNITSNTFSKFLKEFYHPDHNMKEDMKVVIIQNHEPSKEMLTVLTNPKYEENLHYIVGSIFREQVMKMAKIKENKIFILCNQYSADSKKDDTFALLATKAIHEYDPSSKIFVQLVDPEFLLHSWADWDVVMSTQAYKMGIIASNAFNPGFSTFICNLIMSTSVSSNIKKKFPDWVVEYCNGLSQEFYCVSFSKDVNKKYVSRSFQIAVKEIYEQHGILLIGVRSLSSAADGSEVGYHDILMNPLNYEIKSTDEAIIVSRNQESADNFCENGPTGSTIQSYDNNQNTQYEISEETIKELIISKNISESKGQLGSDHYYMWETDLRNVISKHFIVFGQMDHLPALLLALKHYTNQYICFVSDKQPDERWAKLKRNFPNVIYLESSLSDVDELARTAIEDAFHVILLTWFVADSSIQDSGILPIVRIIEENFKEVNFTLELVDESNLKYLNYRPKKELGNISFNVWPRYASSNVFFSSTMDYLMAQAYHSESIVEIIGKLINSNISPNISGVEENNEINVMKLPVELTNYRYIDLFRRMITQKRHIIPLAIVRGKTESENELPFVLINPQPLAPIQKDDLLLMMGSITEEDIEKMTDGMKNQAEGEEQSQDPNQIDNDKKNIIEDQISTSDDLIELAKQLVEEDEALNVQDPILQKKMEDDLNISSKDREILLKQNEEIKKLLSEYNQIRKRVFNK